MSGEAGSLERLIVLISEGLRAIDTCGVPYASTRPPYRQYSLGVGPYSETVLCRKLAEFLATEHAEECEAACTRRFPDLLVPGKWAIELKLARPFGDNGNEAEHWSQNLLHPYSGNTSSLSDAMKLREYSGPECPVVMVIGYEHTPARTDLNVLVNCFEVIARDVLGIGLRGRCHEVVAPLVHAHHQSARIWAWEVVRNQ